MSTRVIQTITPRIVRAALAAVLFAATMVVVVAVPSGPASSTGSITPTLTLSCTAWNSVEVPAGVTSVDFEIAGGGGAGGNIESADGGAGGSGAKVKGTITVTPSSKIWFKVGCGGSGGGSGGAGYTAGGAGGGAGSGGGGGGSSALCLGGSTDCSGGTVVAIAGGGGGGGGGHNNGCWSTYAGGDGGGGVVGGSGTTKNTGTSISGNNGANGSGALNGGGGLAAGTGGTAGSGGTPGKNTPADPTVPPVDPTASPGPYGTGGGGGDRGGGGGGGFAGGGGGGSGAFAGCSGTKRGGGGGGAGSTWNKSTVSGASNPAPAANDNAACNATSFGTGAGGGGDGLDGCGGAVTITFNGGSGTPSFTSQPGSGTPANTLFDQPVVRVLNGSTPVVGTNVALTKQSGPGTLSCTSATVATDANGYAAFSGCQLSSAGTYVLRATSDGNTVDSASFVITSTTSSIVNNGNVAYNAGRDLGADYGTGTGDGYSINGSGSGGTTKQWLESVGLTLNQGRNSRNDSELRMTVIVKHDASDSLKYIWVDRDWDGVNNAVTSTTSTRYDLTGSKPSGTDWEVTHYPGSVYSTVFFRTQVANPASWGTPTAGGTSGDGNRAVKDVNINVGTALGASTGVSTSTVFLVKGGGDDGNDWPNLFNQARGNSPVRASAIAGTPTVSTFTTVSGSSTAYYANADDYDGIGCDVADTLDLRWRRISDGTIDNPGINTGYTDNGTGNASTLLTPPDRGRWVLEGEVVNEDNCNSYGGSGGNPGNDDAPLRGWWQWVATIDVNPATVPALTSLTAPAVAKAGGPLTLTANYTSPDGDNDGTTTGKVQFFSWDTDANNTFETMVENSSEPGGSVPANTIAGSTAFGPGNKVYRVKAGDNGAYIGSSDAMTRISPEQTVTVALKNPVAVAVDCTPNSPTTVPFNKTTASCTATVTDTVTGTGTVVTTPTGTITWGQAGDGTGTFGGPTCNLNAVSTGVASCTVSFGNVSVPDTYTLSATYGGSGLHLTGADVGLTSTGSDTVKFQKRNTQTSVSCPANGTVGTPYNCTVTVQDISATPVVTPTGSVTASVSGGGTITGCASLTAGVTGVATCAVTVSPTGIAGNRVVLAQYVPSSFHTSSANAPGSAGSVTSVAGPATTRRSTASSVTCAPTSGPASTVAVCTATVTDEDSGTKVTPTGSLTIFQSGSSGGSTTACVLSQVVLGTASCTFNYTLNTTVGAHTVTVRHEQTSTHLQSTSTAFVVTMTAGSPPPPPKRATATSLSCTPLSVSPNTGGSCDATVVDVDSGATSYPTGDLTIFASGNTAVGSCTLAPTGGDDKTSTCSFSFTVDANTGYKTIQARHQESATHLQSTSSIVNILSS